MADIRHKRNGVLITSPRNWRELEIEQDFVADKQDDAKINIAELIFAGQEGKNIIERINNGLTGGVGIFEGDEYTIEVGENGSPSFVFEGYLDYSDEGTEQLDCNEVKVALKKKYGNDWLTDKADGFSFRYLEEIGVITSNDFVKVPYVINYVPDGVQLILLSVSLFIMTKELIEAIQDVSDAIADIIDASTPVVGTGVGVGAVVVTAVDVGNIISNVLKAVALIAYTISIVIAIINLIEQIFEQLMPRKRFHMGMRIYTLFEKACEYLGLTFKSNLLEERKDWVIIPSKGHRGGERPTGLQGEWSETGVPSANDGFDTFGDLIRVWSEAFNASYKIVNGEFRFERRDFWKTFGNFVIGPYFTNQERLVDQFKPNVNEVISNYNINWAYDVQDQNTLDVQEGRVFQAILEPKVTNRAELVSLKFLQEIAIPASMGLRKEELTAVEKLLKQLAVVVDGLTGIFGNGTNFAANIEARKGSLLLSNHLTAIPKVVVMSGDRLAKDQRVILSARKLWDDLHFINSFAEINGEHNQYKRYFGVKVPFCEEDFLALIDNNNCLTSDGQEAEIELLKWKAWEDYAIIDYRVKSKYTDNLQIKFIE